MKHKIISILLLCALMVSLCGCNETVGQIADSVADAAMKELKNQVTALLERNKLEVVEMKTAFGDLNDEGSKYQFYIAALVKSNGTAVPQATADAMNKLFTDAGLITQTTSVLESPSLVKKGITFKHEDFSAGNYYVIYGYMADLSIDLPDITLPGVTEKP